MAYRSSDTLPVLSIEGIEDLGGCLEAVVRVSGRDAMRTRAFPGLAERLLERLPGLRRHRCRSGSAHGFITELHDTEMPHVLEHVSLELMVGDGAPRTLHGETRWDFRTDGVGVFRVSIRYADEEVGFRDPALAASALEEGARLINALAAGHDPDQEMTAAPAR